MLAQLAREPFDSERHLFEIKWDGTRAMLFLPGQGQMRLRNRRSARIDERYPEFKSFAELPGSAVLDGEIVVLADGKPSFAKLQQRDNQANPLRIEMLAKSLPATYVAFDLLYLDGRSVMAEPLQQRRERLVGLVKRHALSHLLVPDYLVGPGRRYFAAIEEQGLEGMMAKRLDSPYQPGVRSHDWLKIKVAKSGLFHVIGYVKRGDAAAVSALILGSATADGWQYRGKVGSGFSGPQRKAMYEHLSQLPPLERPPSGPKGATWVVARLQAKVRYLEETEGGRLRSPVFLGFLED